MQFVSAVHCLSTLDPNAGIPMHGMACHTGRQTGGRGLFSEVLDVDIPLSSSTRQTRLSSSASFPSRFLTRSSNRLRPGAAKWPDAVLSECQPPHTTNCDNSCDATVYSRGVKESRGMQLPAARCRLKTQLLQLRYGSLSPQHQSLLASDNQGLGRNTHADAVDLAVRLPGRMLSPCHFRLLARSRRQAGSSSTLYTLLEFDNSKMLRLDTHPLRLRTLLCSPCTLPRVPLSCSASQIVAVGSLRN